MERPERQALLVTGASGFIGKNLVATLGQISGIAILSYDAGNSIEELRDFAGRCDFVFHLAGVNRPPDISEYDTGNRGFTEELLGLLRETGRKVPFLLSSSTQAELDNPYGVSKRAAEEAVRAYGEETGVEVYVYRLPGVFGKWCRPAYNSVVATWCHNIARDLPVRVDAPDKQLTLAYVDDVVAEFVSAMNGDAHSSADGYSFVPRTHAVTLRQVEATLRAFRASRETLVMPDLADDFVKALYATYVSYLPEQQFAYPLEMKHDQRGWLAEFIKSRGFGQLFVSRTKPGITRGNHWHHTKVEKFLVVEGEALVRFRRITDGATDEYRVSGSELKVVDIPTGYTHSISNVGETDLITLFWADEVFDHSRPDTYYEEV